MNDTIKYQVGLRVAASMYILAKRNGEAKNHLWSFVESIALVLGTVYPGEVSDTTLSLLPPMSNKVSFRQLLSSVLDDFGVSEYEQELIDLGTAMAVTVLEKEAS